MKIREYLKNNRILFDGAFSTYLREKFETSIMPEMANIEYPEKVYEVHRAYVDAGAVLIRANTFAASRAALECDSNKLKKVIESGYNIAKKAAGEKAFAAADIGQLPSGANKSEYKEIAEIFLELGADIFVFETLNSLDDVLESIKYIKHTNPESFIIVQFCVNQHGYSETGESAASLLKGGIECEEIDAVGFNCGVGPAHLYNIYKGLDISTDKYLTALPNSGYPSMIQDRMVFLDNINYFTELMEKIAELGIDMLGGCCGTTPPYIKALGENIDFTHINHNRAIEAVNAGALTEPKNNLFFADKKAGEKIIAVELDPPKNGDCTALMETANYLKHHNVDIITFADSPSGRTRADSMLMSLKVKNETGMRVMPHICCRDTNAIGLSSKLLGAYINDIKNFLIITGDPVPNTSRENVKSVFNFDSVKLMNMVAKLNEENFPNDKLCYGGALGYDKLNIDIELKRAKRKEAAGAQFFLTQPVYCAEDVEKLRYLKSNLTAKVLVGIMPLASYTNASFIKNEISGIRVPDEVLNRFKPDMDREASRALGVEICKEIMKITDDFADGYYFMIPFNRLSTAKQLIK